MGVWEAEEMQSHKNSAFSLFSKDETKCFVRKTKPPHWSMTGQSLSTEQGLKGPGFKGTLVLVYYPHVTQEQSKCC